jgi:coenzyme F420-0:L-glutamate ligase/coenzyme F420-1:gamma-L-glutamate ligase
VIVAVVPFRAVESSKERMGPALGPAARSELAARLLERTLLATGGAALVNATILVSPDPLARALARGLGAEAIDDAGVPLNEAISIGLRAAEHRGASAAIVLPVDLAEVSAAALDALIDDWRRFSASNATAAGLLPADDGGTAALMLPLPTRVTPRFGPDSAAAHVREFTTHGLTSASLHSPLSHDLDTAADLVAATSHRPAQASGGIIAFAIDGLGEIAPGDDLPALIAEALAASTDRPSIGGVRADDVIAVTQKIVSKAEGAIVDLTAVTPRAEAVAYAERWKRDARQVEVVLREAVRVVRMDRGVIITETSHGFVLANSGVDASNVGPRSGDVVTLLPRDPDASARRIRAAIEARLGVAPGVIITDSFGRPWRLGITDVAIGVAGISPLEDLRGRPDADGRLMAATVRAVADQIAATAELALGKTARRPLALVRGARPLATEAGSIRDSLMPADWDLFR